MFMSQHGTNKQAEWAVANEAQRHHASRGATRWCPNQASACIFRLTILKRTYLTTLIKTMIHSWSDLQMAICSPSVASC
ncbi:hypothetical protein ACQJBY_015595 [Aegilops geniculata]